ncbi:hypothetical protein [Streptomyces sp. NBC_01363]|uniref:hypothetical protein n=1 Tax=Streptomyces sp. NBC_01363 TaxID=2903840 RepID=UPI002256F4B7|nr:hypothetical protein [Streptomyces sp. NBC_01363]MCX4735919.1 hypothetical protein [Streptomyces sp. NBC_01363]
MAGTGLAALAVAAVHNLTAPPLAVVVYADVVTGLCWLVAAFLLLRGHRSPDSPGDNAPGPRHHRAVRFSTDGEPVARSHWNSRHRY